MHRRIALSWPSSIRLLNNAYEHCPLTLEITTHLDRLPSLIRLSVSMQPIQSLSHSIRTPGGNLIPSLCPPLDTARRSRRAGLNVVLCFRGRVHGRVGEGVDVASEGVTEA